MGKKRSVLETQERKLITYPKQRYFYMVIADSFLKDESKSERLQEIIKKHYDSLSFQEQENLLKKYKEMSPRQKENPKSF